MTKGAFLKEEIGLFLKIDIESINKIKFSIAESKEGILFTSKRKGLKRKVNIFNGNG